MRAGAARERDRLRGEIGQIRGGIALLMKQRNGGRWEAAERREIRAMLRSLTEVSPYLVVLALPGSVLLLPLLAWHLDSRRQRRLPTLSPSDNLTEK
jgi:hypothetical protein